MSENQANEVSSNLEGESIASAFEALDNPAVEATEDEKLAKEAQALQDAPAEEEADTQEAKLITVEVDGKMVELTPEQVAEAYKSGLRQSDYSKKTAELAQERNSVQETAKRERDDYAQKLNNYAIQLEGALTEQSQINWQELLDSDPVEYLRQERIYNERQSAYQNALRETEQIKQIQLQETQESFKQWQAEEADKLMKAIPTWKDSTKAKAEKAEIMSFMADNGFSNEEINNITDHRHVLLLRDAMRFNKLLKQAPAATKKVELAPTKVERSGIIDKSTDSAARKAAMKVGKPLDLRDTTNAFSHLFQ